MFRVHFSHHGCDNESKNRHIECQKIGVDDPLGVQVDLYVFAYLQLAIKARMMFRQTECNELPQFQRAAMRIDVGKFLNVAFNLSDVVWDNHGSPAKGTQRLILCSPIES